jgi:L-aspartate oxidase
MHADYLVIGAGVAGLRAAIELASTGSVLVVAKDALRESSSEYAQGGIAVALAEDDSVDLHAADTLAAGDGLCDPAAVRALVEGGPAAIRQLIEWGAAFDCDAQARLAFTREGAHSRDRVLHAHGDSTGREIARTLYRKAASLPNISFQTYAAVTDLLTENGAAAGATVFEEGARRITALRARAVLLATGGLGHVFLESTNPDIATGDGVAMAWRAGAEISDIEFVQFHPTALHVEGAPRFLLSEALRGEGAVLRNAAGERFTDELAPRDVVARAIVAELRRTGAPHVYLDLSHRGADFVSTRFPRIYQTCLRYGIDLGRQGAPVHPAAHYAMGGVRADIDGHTSIPRLYAAGECACTGVHGANRLASNSLLEAMVFGARAGAAMREWGGAEPAGPGVCCEPRFPSAAANELRRLAWEHCGIVRSAAGLREALHSLDHLRDAAGEPSVASCELRSIREVAALIARCALAREESRGAHYRVDFGEKRPEFQLHSRTRKGHDVTFQ